MLYFYLALPLVLSKSIPPPVSMNTMTLLKPEENICAQILYVFYKHIWIWISIALGIFTLSILLIVIKCLKKPPAEQKSAPIQIFLQGRRILMPKTICFQGLRLQKSILDEVSDENLEKIPLKSREAKKEINFGLGIFAEAAICGAHTNQGHFNSS